jgi:glutamate/aspartate transport system substrate-binding protein
LRIESADSYAAAIDLVAKGAADAIVADDVLLASALAQAGRSRDFRFLSEALSLEPYGIMFPRNDAAFADVVERALRGLAESREVLWIYDRWFVKPLPSAKRIGLPMSQTLRRSLELIGLPRD